jgi:hypothetical protein
MYIARLVEYPLFLSNLNYLDRFSKSVQKPNFMKFLPVGADMFYGDEYIDRQTDRQTGITRLIIAVCSIANTPNKQLFLRPPSPIGLLADTLGVLTFLNICQQFPGSSLLSCRDQITCYPRT